MPEPSFQQIIWETLMTSQFSFCLRQQLTVLHLAEVVVSSIVCWLQFKVGPCAQSECSVTFAKQKLWKATQYLAI